MIDDTIELILAMKAPNTQRHYRSVIDIFVTFCGKPLQKITPRDALEYFAHLKRALAPDGSLYAGKTVLNHFHSLHAIYENLLILDFVKRNPMKAVKFAISSRQRAEKRPTKLIPFDLIKRIIRAPEGRTKRAIRDRAMLALLFGAGLRRSEALGLDMDDVKVSPQGVLFVELRSTKAGRRQVRVLAKFARPFVTRLVSLRKSEGAKATDPLLVFYYRAGKVRGRISDRTLARAFKRYCRVFKIDAAPHAARATFATRLKSMGYSDRDTAEAMGHLTETMVRVYDKRRRELEDSPALKLSYE